MTTMRKTLGHTIVYMTALVLNRGAAFLLVPVFTRVWVDDPASFARWDLCTTTLLLIYPVLDFGMAGALMRFYHEYDTESEQRRVFNTSFFFVLGLHVVLLLIGFALARPLASLVFNEPDEENLIRMVLVLGSVTALGKQGLSILRAAHRSITFAVLNVLRGVVGPLAIILFVVFLQQGVAGALWGDLVGLTVMGILSFFVLRQWIRLEFSFSQLGPMLRFALPLIPMGISAMVLMISDRYFLSRWVGLEGMAPYSLGFKVAMIMSLFTQALQLSWVPAAFQLAKEEDAQYRFAQLFRVLFTGLCLMALGLSCLAPELVRVFAPAKAYTGAELVVPWIAFSYAMHAGAQTITVSFSIVKRTMWATVVATTAALVKVILSYFVIMRYGILGAATVTFAAFTVELLLGIALTQWVYPLPHAKGRLIWLAGATVLAMWGCFFGISMTYWPGILVRAIVLCSFAGFCVLGMFSHQERLQTLEFARTKMHLIARRLPFLRTRVS